MNPLFQSLTVVACNRWIPVAVAVTMLVTVGTGCGDSSRKNARDNDRSDGAPKAKEVKNEKDGTGNVVGVRFPNIPVTLEAVAGVKKHAEVSSVLFYECDDFRSGAIAELIKLPKLRTVEFIRCKVDAKSLTELSKCEQLAELQFGETPLTADNLALFEICPRLESLTLKGKSCALDVLVGLSKLKTLRILHLDLRSVGLAKVPQLQALNELRLLKMPTVDLTDSDLAALPRLPKLEEIVFPPEKITSQGVVQLKDLPSLKRLSLAGARISSDDVVHFQQFPALEELDISGCNDITNAAAAHLVPCRKLRRLRMLDCGASGEALTTFVKMKSLKHLTMSNLQVKAAQATAFREARPDCTLEIVVLPPPPRGG